MLKLTTTATVTTTTEITLKPSIKHKLTTALKKYQALKGHMDALKDQLETCKDTIETVRETVGERSFAVNGFKITRVTGTQRTLNKQKLVELGCALAWLEEATEEKPKKAHTKVTCPGEKEEDY